MAPLEEITPSCEVSSRAPRLHNIAASAAPASARSPCAAADQNIKSSVRRAGLAQQVDISKIAPGQAIKTSWRKQPVFIRNLMPKEIAEANAVPLSELRDPQTLAERTKPGKENWLITRGVCTQLGCVPLGVGEGENRGPFGAISARAWLGL